MKIGERQDWIVLALSVVYIGGILGGIYGWGIAKGWDAATPILWPNSDRFWPKPGTNGTHRTNCSTFDPSYNAPIRRSTTDCYSRWYYWQLPEDQVTVVTRLAVWLLYCVHQISHWVFIWFAQNDKETSNLPKEEFYSSKLRWYNWALVGVTYLFHVLHLIQTHTTYDATAKDVVIQSSQGSVIMMLVFVILLEYRDRGMLFGWPNPRSTDAVAKRVRLAPGPIEYVRKYHGYAFSWAVIYTFWYHPMENTFGHAMGFVHTFLVMIQGSLIYQKVHLNKYWRLLLESWVWFHGFSVAVMVAEGIWWKEMAPFMFGFGFGTLFFVTQIFGLPIWSRISPYWRILPPACWFLFAILVVVLVDDIKNSFLMGLVAIPAGQLGCAFAAWIIIYLFTLCKAQRMSSLGVVFQAAMTCLVYAVFVLISFLLHHFGENINLPFMIITYILVFIFLIGCVFTWFCFPLPEKLVGKNSVSPVVSPVASENIEKNTVQEVST